MNALTEYVLAFFDLLRAEGGLFRRRLVILALALGLVAVAVVLGLAGALGLLGGLALVVRNSLGIPWAAILAGAAGLAASAVTAWAALRVSR